MNQQPTCIKRALISVSDKTGIVEFARELHRHEIEIISTGGTGKLLREANIPARDVAEMTEFPEMMDGRVKTLHPKIHGGILGQRDEHQAVAQEYQINWIDLVVVNLYPFAETIKKTDVTFQEAIENIDIGGPSMIRAAAKNMGWVGVVIDPNDYSIILSALETEKTLNYDMREFLAKKAFAHTAHYDAMIHAYLEKKSFPAEFNLHLEKKLALRYGENPHQAAAAYQFSDTGILSATQHQGKQLSFNNIADADAAFSCLQEFSEPTCVIVKHANPCGIATRESITQAFQSAWAADPISAFGSVLALNREIPQELAEILETLFIEVIIAPSYSKEALEILKSKPNLRLLVLNSLTREAEEFKFISGGVLIQERDTHLIEKNDLKIVTAAKPTEQDISAMLFAWRAVKHIKSNAILIAKDQCTVGIGAGQVSRIDAVEMALHKAGQNLADTILASDAFFPFRDSIDRLANTGIRSIIQPGGSVKDEEVIEACDEHGIAMVFTGKRCFKH